jgi:hypothetical protein
LPLFVGCRQKGKLLGGRLLDAADLNRTLTKIPLLN